MKLYLIFMHAVSYQGKVAFETTTFGCVWSDKLLVKLDLQDSLTNNFFEKNHLISQLFISEQTCAPSEIGLQDFLVINIPGRNQFIPLSFFFFVYLFASFIKLCRSQVGYDLLIKSRIYFVSQFLRLP